MPARSTGPSFSPPPMRKPCCQHGQREGRHDRCRLVYAARRCRGKIPIPASRTCSRSTWTAARLTGCNAGAPIFDTHFTGDDYKSVAAGKAGHEGASRRREESLGRRSRMEWRRFSSIWVTKTARSCSARCPPGIVQNLSFGAWIYSREKTTVQAQTGGMPEGKPAYSNPNGDRHVHGDRLGAVRDFACSDPGRFQHNVLGAQPTGELFSTCRPAGRSSTGNQPTKGETCHGRNHYAGGHRGPCERAGPRRGAR